MKRIGLALSGGGFRASLYHLGLLRFLRDAGILAHVTDITSVSGGSISAAHVALNWGRYTGSASEFDTAAGELLAFVGMDIRNRIFRRFPLAVSVRWAWKLLGRPTRVLTRTGLLEYHYEKYLYGDTSLFELPETPRLHLLATNLNEGCLCSFGRDGILMARPQPGYTYSIHRVHAGLATVPMAVAASSAYPGFFPPLELSGAEVGARLGEFGHHAFTDGGVFDNLGVRMFRCLERPLMAETPLSPGDFFDLRETLDVLRHAGESIQDTPLRRLWQVAMATGGGGNANGSRQEPLLLTAAEAQQGSSAPVALLERGGNGHGHDGGNGGGNDNEDALVARMWEAMRRYQFYYDPLFAGLGPADAEAEAYIRANRSTARILDMADRIWLNRHMLEAAFRQATGRPCFRRLNSGLDGVLVSDVGKPIEVQSDRRHGGVIRTALRASDILMDRVWQLENETFHDAPGFVFAPITDVVDPAEDPTALHPEIQRQASNIRTDLDRFSPLEISTLIRHGYCVARKACRGRPDLFGDALPDNAPWDPIPAARGAAPPPKTVRLDGAKKGPAPTTVEARSLQSSAFRRIWSALPDYRDWTSFVYVPILVPLLFLLPYVVVKYYQRSHRISQLVESLSQGSQDLTEMSQLLESPSTPWKGVGFEDITKPAVPDVKGFEILQDSRVLDLRSWQPSLTRMNDPTSLSFGYRRVKVAKVADYAGDNLFYITLLAMDPDRTAVRFPPQELRPRLLRAMLSTANPTDKLCRWQIAYDLQQVPPDEFVDVMVEYYSPGNYIRRGETSSTLPLDIHTFTAEFTLWVMLPTGKQRKGWRVVRYPHDKPLQADTVNVVTEYLSDDESILAFKLLSLKPDYSYEVQWFYR